MNWTEERVDTLKKLWGEGLSCSLIGNEMGITRNAVIGKVHRLSLDKRPNAGGEGKDKKKHGVRVKQIRFWTRKPTRKLNAEHPMPAEFLNLTIEEIKDGQCRYPRGEEVPYLFCGQPTKEGSSYCTYCHSLVWQTPYNRAPQYSKYGKFLSKIAV